MPVITEDEEELDVGAMLNRWDRLKRYGGIAIVLAVLWFTALPFLKAIGLLTWIERIGVWSPLVALSLGCLLSIFPWPGKRRRYFPELFFSWALFLSTSHFLLAALRFGELHSITKCCGNSNLITRSDDPLFFGVYFLLWLWIWSGSATWVAFRFIDHKKNAH